MEDGQEFQQAGMRTSFKRKLLPETLSVSWLEVHGWWLCFFVLFLMEALAIEPRASCMLSTRSTAEVYPLYLCYLNCYII